MPNLLMKAERLTKQYGSKKVVNEVSLHVYENEIVAMIGPNGAGKSTTIEMMLGLVNPDSGEVFYWDKNFNKAVGVQLQATSFFPKLSTLENLRLFAAFHKMKISKQDGMELLTLCGLKDVIHTEASKLSGGQQKRLAIAIAVVHNPKIVFMDEPTAALDPISRREIHQLITNLYNRGTTIVFTSHDMDEVTKLSQRVIMIDQGVVIAEGSAIDLCDRYGVQHLEELYLHLTVGGAAK